MLAAPASRNRRLLWAAGAPVLVGLTAAGASYWDGLVAWADPAALTALVESAGPAAPAVFFLVQVAQVVIAPVPSPAVALAGGYLFRPVVGSVLSVAGVAVGSAGAFWLARRFGRTAVERFVPSAAVVRFDALTATRGQAGLFVAFLVPGFPDDALCFVGGLTAIPLRRLVALAVLGRAPSIVALSLLGAGIAEGNATLVVALGGLLAVLTVAGYLFRDRLLGGRTRPAPTADATVVASARVATDDDDVPTTTTRRR